MKKKCFKCLRVKPITAFYKHSRMGDGHLNKCKACTKKDVRRRYYDPDSRERIVKYEKERARRPERKSKALEYQRASRAKHPGKNRARAKVFRSVVKGEIKKQPCNVCGYEKVEAHHIDYRKPLDVVWLCRKHHLIVENKTPY